MKIEPASAEDLPEILEIYRLARDYMASHGNPSQWAGGYPSRQLVESDIRAGRCMLCREGHRILGVFTFFVGEDPTYATIYDGRWQNSAPYGVMHRVAVRVHGQGVASFCFQWCFQQCGNLRIDTHEDNIPMQHALLKNGFVRCGTIFLADGQSRIAFQKIH